MGILRTKINTKRRLDGSNVLYLHLGECHMTEVADPHILAVSAVVVEMDTRRTGEFSRRP